MEEKIERLWNEVRELSLGSNSNAIETLPSPPSPIHFLRDFVSKNKPCLISNAVAHWPALSLWPDLSYLSTVLSNTSVSLHLTPDGRADSVVNDSLFASAHVECVPFTRAIDLVLNTTNAQSVAYLQQQNDCFRTEYNELAGDSDPHLPWATEAIGSLPEAVNLWIGNHKSETCFHKDHYENLYVVVSGEKHFLLLPPTDVHRMYIRDYPAAHYIYSKESEGQLKLEMEEPLRYVPWSSVNPYPCPEDRQKEVAKYPLYFNGPDPFKCTVKAGQVLYLPSMWFHHVRQSPGDGGCTIALNYWYDMQFDIKYAYFNFLESLPFGSRLIGTNCEVSDVSRRKLRDGCNSVSIMGAVESNEDYEND
ncbi:hypothetical protein K2173_009462 [Erythroxylum novogranatense]|uniref:JmjC domain-containing protein n=1 Tax=Erythroxylum novogranatense TaxID=1862640 RepID=A0AAV8U581_9ROSI|nr:hypothetical protein K2173_009462 [Erythroxylum novogranatense]